MLFLLTLVTTLGTVPGQISIKDQARVVWVGSTWVEREQQSSHWEAAVHALFPGKKIVWRNLGWSGDNVSGESRSGFGSVEDGYKELLKQIKDLKPNLILVSYGFNEAFEGAKGIPTFKTKYARLLKDIKPLGAKIHLTGLQPVVTHPPELVSLEALDTQQKQYNQAIQEVALAAEVGFLPTTSLVLASPALSSNGIHLTPEGYRNLVPGWVKMLGLNSLALGFRAELAANSKEGKGCVVEGLDSSKDGNLTFQLRSNCLPIGTLPQGELVIGDLRNGNWELREGKTVIAMAKSEEWAKGIPITLPGDRAQMEALRKEVAAKNQQFFYRWRPQNETYLFGFRKHEQGNNSKEIPEFDAHIEALEKQIILFSQPKNHSLSLIRKD